ncbi:MAG TPA: tetratricopeptide repeat protein [Burkholderiaceae bacterium]|nr:tetratricopeptide repeat protein [Burkholderiaceae bacterium]
MAKQLDLQEQEQVDAIKAFWSQYGNLVTWVVTILLLGYAGFMGWSRGEQEEGRQASTLYAQVEDAATSGDVARAQRIFDDMKSHRPWYMLPSLTPPPAYTQQAGLMLSKLQVGKGKAADALVTLRWVAQNGNAENAAVARLALAGILADQKKFDDALKELAAVTNPAFNGLVADRRGDILLAQGQRDAARTAYRAAFDAMPATTQYRVLVEAKLATLGGVPASAAASGATP